MEFQTLIKRAIEIRKLYAELERRRHQRAWTDEELALGFVGDVVKLVQAKNGVRNIPDVDEKLAHELADCLWSVIVLADAYGVDLERAFTQTMDDLEKNIK
jgi:NTP pyrophosphatase (non-canonical NTP hydrolase)